MYDKEGCVCSRWKMHIVSWVTKKHWGSIFSRRRFWWERFSCHFYFLFLNDFSRHVLKPLTQKFFKQSFLWTTGRMITKARGKKDVTLDDVDDKRYWGRDLMQVERQENGWMSGLQERDLFESLSYLHSSCFAQKHHSSLKVVNTFLSLNRQLLPTFLFSFIRSPTTQ